MKLEKYLELLKELKDSSDILVRNFEKVKPIRHYFSELLNKGSKSTKDMEEIESLLDKLINYKIIREKNIFAIKEKINKLDYYKKDFLSDEKLSSLVEKFEEPVLGLIEFFKEDKDDINRLIDEGNSILFEYNYCDDNGNVILSRIILSSLK